MALRQPCVRGTHNFSKVQNLLKNKKIKTYMQFVLSLCDIKSVVGNYGDIKKQAISPYVL